jgi:ribosomal protein S27E
VSDPLIEQQLIQIRCSQCGTTAELTIRTARASSQLPCEHCGHTLVLGTSDINSQIRSIEKSIARMRTQLLESHSLSRQPPAWWHDKKRP